MDFAFTEEQDATGELAAQILGDLATHDRLRELERGDGLRHDPDCWSALVDAGLTGIAVPERDGGAGLDLVALGRLLEAVGRTGAAVPLWETLGLGALPVAHFGDDATRARWLPSVVDGSAVLTAAWDVADRDPDALGVTATPAGDGWALAGAVTCVPAGQLAAGVVVPARTPDGPALLVAEVDATVDVVPLVTTSGSPDAALRFDATPAALLGRGSDALRWARERAVATQNAVALGNAEAMLDLIAAYTKERKQFDVPIATFQAVGHRAADCYIDTEAIRLTCWAALSRLDEGLDAADEVDVAKFWSAWAGQRITLAAAHLHGGVGVDRDYPLARHFTKAKELELGLGGASEHLAALGRRLAA